MNYKNSFILIGILILNVLNAQFKEIYENPNFDQITENHKKIAILPFTVVLSTKAIPEGMTEEELIRQQEEEGKSFQSSVFSRFLKKSKNYKISFQDVDRTNTLLLKSDITHSDLGLYGKEELAQILGVDAVISGQIHRDKPMKAGAAVALAIFTGFGGATSKAKLDLKIHNGLDGELLWTYNHRARGGIGNDVESVVLVLMKQVARRFPYKK